MSSRSTVKGFSVIHDVNHATGTTATHTARSTSHSRPAASLIGAYTSFREISENSSQLTDFSDL